MCMKAMVCELCSSNSFTKLEDGNYQCDYCRTKYTPSQAKTLLVEGVVKVDRSDEIGKLLAIASNAYEAGNYDEAYEYANRILEIDHEHARAWFLKGASAGWGSNLDNCQGRLREMEHCFKTGSQELQGADSEVYLAECSNVMCSVVEAIYSISLGHTREFITVGDSWMGHLGRSEALMDSALTAYALADDMRGLKIAIKIASENIEGEFVTDPDYMPHVKQVSPEYKETLRNQINHWSELVRRKEPSFQAAVPETKQLQSGCFVVTATFGNEDAMPVVLLRKFRDEVLLMTKPGKAFVDWYYQHGPRAAEKISRSLLLRGVTFIALVVPVTLLALPTLLVARLFRGNRHEERQ